MKPLLSRPTLLPALALAAALASTGALAHGDDSHAGHGAASRATQQAWGIAGDAAAVSREIAVSLHDSMRFSPARLEVREGETVRLKLANDGYVMHELVLGTEPSLREHAAAMLRNPAMAHAEAHAVHVAPGDQGELVWTFNRPGLYTYACLLPGHFEAGMSGTVEVLPR